jgi:hypothetical protein
VGAGFQFGTRFSKGSQIPAENAANPAPRVLRFLADSKVLYRFSPASLGAVEGHVFGDENDWSGACTYGCGLI